jgi:dipeptidyl aminopeptidase/acylaminoacyl peptidase
MRLLTSVAAASLVCSGIGAGAFAAGFVSLSPLAAQAQNMPSPPLEYYGDLPSIEEAEVSPSGAYTALLMTMQGERVITILDAAGEPVKQIVVGDAKVRGIEWVGEEAILLLRTETGRLPRQYVDSKAEFLRGNVIPLDDASPVVSIFAEQRYIANAITRFYGIRLVDGRWTGYFGGFRRGSTSGNRDQLLDRRPALFAVDLVTGETDLKAYPDDYPATRDWLIGDDGEVGAVLQLDARNGNWRVENGDGDTIARGRQERGRVSLIGFGADGDSVLYSYYDDTSRGVRRFQIPLTGGTPTEIWEDAIVRQWVRKPFSSRVLGLQNESDGSIELSDERAQAVLSEALGAFSYASYAEIAGFTADFSTLIATTSGNYDSGTWFRMNGATGERSILGLERPAIQGPAIGKVSTFTYEAQDGLEINGILTLPPGRDPVNLPVIILPHGGPTAHNVERFDWRAQAFASRGYAVLQPNFRGSTGRGAGFVEAGDGEWGRKMQTDKSDGLMALAQAGIVDPARACIVGSSYGGYAALAGVTLQQGFYRCAVSVNGVANLEPLLREFRTGSRDVFTRSFDRQFGEDVDLDALSPTQNARNADAPVLLIHGRDDTVVPFAQSLMMKDALEDAGKPVEFLALDGEDHWLSQSATRRQMLDAAVAFVERHNPPD